MTFATTVPEPGALYAASVMHRRHVAPLYRFVYRLFYVLVDIDRLAALDGALRFFSHNRFNLVALHDRDYGDGRRHGLRTWVERLLAIRDIRLDGGRVRLLTLPRVLGYGFNPISLYYCEHADGTLRAVIAEVRNTFGERHCYLLAEDGRAMDWDGEHHKDKRFHVSPFFDMTGRYRFRIGCPAESVRVHIREFRDDAPVLDATLAGDREPLTDAALARHVLRMPWATLKVVLAIHWEALRIWLRGARFHGKPAPPMQELS
jgi:uncharacterized protein